MPSKFSFYKIIFLWQKKVNQPETQTQFKINSEMNLISQMNCNNTTKHITATPHHVLTLFKICIAMPSSLSFGLKKSSLFKPFLYTPFFRWVYFFRQVDWIRFFQAWSDRKEKVLYIFYAALIPIYNVLLLNRDLMTKCIFF